MIKVLVIDDSAFFRVHIKEIIDSDNELKVVETARDGESALEFIKRYNPDVITLDFELADIDGTELIKKINQTTKTPVVLVSCFSNLDTEKAITSLEAGVVDFVEKPDSFNRELLAAIKEEIIDKIKAAYSLSSKAEIFIRKGEKRKESVKFSSTTKKIVVIASSTGGPQTLERFLQDIPENIPCPILIVQHMPPIFTKSLADRLNRICEIEVVEAKDNEEIVPGRAYIAPGNYHMILKQAKEGVITKDIISLSQEEKEERVRPCANKLFRSVAPIYKDNTIGIVLTGMGKDGTNGAYEIKKYKGSIIAQSEKTSIIYGMPKSIAENDLADEIVDIDKMSVALLQIIDI